MSFTWHMTHDTRARYSTSGRFKWSSSSLTSSSKITFTKMQEKKAKQTFRKSMQDFKWKDWSKETYLQTITFSSLDSTLPTVEHKFPPSIKARSKPGSHIRHPWKFNIPKGMVWKFYLLLHVSCSLNWSKLWLTWLRQNPHLPQGIKPMLHPLRLHPMEIFCLLST